MLQNNRIGRLPSGLFKPLTGLRHLNLASNHLHVLETDVFVGLQSLGDLSVDDNRLEELDHRAFNATRSLQSFSARGNRLRTADLRILDHAPTLNHLELAQNRITDLVPPAAAVAATENPAGFSPASLSLLSLADNYLRTLSGKVEGVLRRDGAHLRLHGNPWHCDCRLSWLVTLLNQGRSLHRVDKPADVVCTAPQYHRDRKVIAYAVATACYSTR